MTYIYNLYNSDDRFGFKSSYHIQCDLPPHKFRTIMMEFRRNKDEANTPEAFIDFMKKSFGDSFQLFDYDDIVQFDADQENSAILANLLDEVDGTI
ncbi:hypothetical protein [Peribacillus tepidiphilus]|uniref:hypothetical protein n=1 Tax=Peribacillus tepidiphilus TaxID=2652445 RepID=UPI001290A49F|nr:hypothetical protein [Peribacillus tepidiphilus]